MPSLPDLTVILDSGNPLESARRWCGPLPNRPASGFGRPATLPQTRAYGVSVYQCVYSAARWRDSRPQDFCGSLLREGASAPNGQPTLQSWPCICTPSAMHISDDSSVRRNPTPASLTADDGSQGSSKIPRGYPSNHLVYLAHMSATAPSTKPYYYAVLCEICHSTLCPTPCEILLEFSIDDYEARRAK